MDLALGNKSISCFERRKVSRRSSHQNMDESVTLVSLVPLSRGSISFDAWWHRANLVNAIYARILMEKLARQRYLRKRRLEGGTVFLELQDQGFARLNDLGIFLKKIGAAHQIKSEECLI
jgi:hypothetical protein